ncbi:MAG: dTDP-4-dehydrorhamnose reductase, partial [Solirubrobacterales bacterium]
LDITDADHVRRVIAAAEPRAVVNCAAWTDVDGAETAEAVATAVNGAGAGNVARAAVETGARLVHVSTDYVFDGAKGEPWVESDPVAPIGAYGRSKLAGEEAVAEAGGEYAIVRTAWLFGAGGRNFVDTMLRLAERQNEVTVVRDQVGSPTYTWHLAYGIVRLIEGIEYGIHHMAAAGQCSWYEFAREIFEQAEVECKVLSITSEEFGAAAARPAFSALVSQREHAIRLPSWRDGLAGYLAQRQAEASE